MSPHSPALLAFVGSKQGKNVTSSLPVGGSPVIVIFAHSAVQKSPELDWHERRRQGS